MRMVRTYLPTMQPTLPTLPPFFPVSHTQYSVLRTPPSLSLPAAMLDTYTYTYTAAPLDVLRVALGTWKLEDSHLIHFYPRLAVHP